MNISRIGFVGLLSALAFNAWSAGAPPPAALKKSDLNVTGTWNAKVEGRGPPTSYVFVFNQDKDKLTGTVSINGAAPVEITDGKVYRTKITFSVSATMPAMPMGPNQQAPAEPRTMVTKYTADVEGDEMTLTPQMGGMGGGMGGPPPGGGGGMPMGGGMGGMGGGGGMSSGPPGGMGGGMGGGGMGGPPGGGGGMPMGGGMGGMRTPIKATRSK